MCAEWILTKLFLNTSHFTCTVNITWLLLLFIQHPDIELSIFQHRQRHRLKSFARGHLFSENRAAESWIQWERRKLPPTVDTSNVKKQRHTDCTVCSRSKLLQLKMQFMCIFNARSLLVWGKKSCHICKRMCQLERSQLSIENKWGR